MRYRYHQTIFIFIFLIFITSINNVHARFNCLLQSSGRSVYFNTTDESFTFSRQRGEDIKIYEAKKCPCSEKEEYCLTINGENTCSTQRWSNEPAETFCYKTSWPENILQLFYLPSVLMMVIVLLMPFTTLIGRNSMTYIFSFCFPFIKKTTN
jgi:hypothetical protein